MLCMCVCAFLLYRESLIDLEAENPFISRVVLSHLLRVSLQSQHLPWLELELGGGGEGRSAVL
jgi:hypothetical protein